MTGAGVVVVALGVGALGVGVGDDEGLDTGLDDALAVGVTEDSTLGARRGVAVGGRRDDADELDRGLGDDAGPEAELAGHPELPLTDAAASVPDVAQPSAM